MKYESIPEVVTAEVYKEGLEDGWTLPWSEFFENHISYFSNKDEAEIYAVELLGGDYADLIVETPVPYIGNKRDNSMVRPGDFIITHDNGMKSVMSPTEFHAKYREVNE